MNYLIVSPNSPFLSVGGIERYIRNTIDFCGKRQGTYHFVLPRRSSKEEIIKNGNVYIHFVDCLTLSFKRKTKKSVRRLVGKEMDDKGQDFFVFINGFLEEKKINAVIAQNFHYGLPPSFSLLLNMACYAKQVPIFLQIHSFASNDLQAELIRSLFWKKILCVSKSVTGDCFQKGVSIKRLATRYLGVNLMVFNTDLDKNWLRRNLKLKKKHIILLSASRILQGYSDTLQEKGIINLLDAFSKLVHRYSALRLVLAIGKPPRRLADVFDDASKKLDGYIQIHGVQGKVIAKTFPLEKMPFVYAGADIFVLPSENETLGQVYLEAMACGIPVIGTNVGGVPEIISDRYNGFLVQPNDASMLAQTIDALLKDNSLRTSVVRHGLSVIRKKFNINKTLNDTFQYIENILRKK